jgi:hypothetical protein
MRLAQTLAVLTLARELATSADGAKSFAMSDEARRRPSGVDVKRTLRIAARTSQLGGERSEHAHVLAR